MEGLAIMMIVFLLVILAVIVVSAIGLWKVFEKAGEEGWKALIPVYNLLILLDIVGKPRWWTLLIVANLFTSILKLGAGADDGMAQFLDLGATIASLVFTIWMFNMLSKSYGKSEGFTAGLFFFPFVTLPMLGFGSAKYLGPYGDKERFEAYQTSNGEGFDFEQNKLV